MKGARLARCVALASVLAAAPGAAEEAAPAASGAGAEARPERVSHDALRIELTPDAEARAGLELAPARSAELVPLRTAYGRVLDPLPLLDSVLARSAALRLLESARLELRRVEALRDHDRNASERELEAARLAFERAKLDLHAASARVSSAWGARAAARSDLDALVERLAAGDAAIGRLDLPAGEAASADDSQRIEVSLPARGAPSIPALVLGPAPSTDPMLQGAGYLVLLDAAPPPPGSPLVARLPSGERIAGVFVPAAAIVWSEGEALVFVEAAAHVFESRAVERLGALDGGWLAAGGVAVGDRLVVRGAQQLLSRALFPAEPAD